MVVQIRKLSDIITGTHVTTCSIHPSVVPKLMQEAELSHNVYKAPICYISNPTFANFHACKLDPLCSLSQASAVMTPWKTFINPVEVKEGGAFCNVTLRRCCCGLLDRCSLLAQLLLCLQDRVLKLGFLIDVAVT